MDESDFQFRKAFFQALADEPLEPGDPRYVDLSGLPGRDAVDRLAETVRLSPGQSVQLFSGPRGSGKTTELKRLHAQLTKEGYKVIYVDMADFVNVVAPMHIGQFWLMLALAFEMRLELSGYLNRGFRKHSIIPIVIRLSQGIYLPVADEADLVHQLNHNSAFVTKLRTQIGDGFEMFLPQIRESFDEIVSLISAMYGDSKELVVIFDSIDHITTIDTNKVGWIEGMERLFCLHRADLSIPHVHLIYSVPEPLDTSPKIRANYDYFFSMTNVFSRDSQGNRIGRASQAFREILIRRGGDERVSILGDYDLFQLVVDTSRGNIRDFLSRIRLSLINANVGKPNETPRPDTVDPAKLSIGVRLLRLAHIRLFENLTIDFTRDGKPRPFTVILAENGHGKTTLLQAIALAASGVAGANLLAGNAAAFFDRRLHNNTDETADVCQIEATFDIVVRPDETSSLQTKLSGPPTWKEFKGSSTPSIDQIRAQDKPQWFVAGYGTGRMLPRSRASKEPGRRSVDRLRSLFDAEPLVATGFADILADLLGRGVANEYAETLRTVLIGDGRTPGLLPHDESLHVEELELRGSGAVRESTDLIDADRFVLKLGDSRIKLPASWLSAGYQSTIAWVADLLGQVTLEAGRVLRPDEIAGIVLIDEIDLHLHPRWQVSLVSSLCAIFPKVQFIATTHSPMVLPALRQDEIILLSLDAHGNIQQRPAPVAPALKTGSEILECFFGIEKLYPAELGQALQEYTHLASDPERTDDEDARMQTLRKKLQEADADPGWEPQPRMMHEEGP